VLALRLASVATLAAALAVHPGAQGRLSDPHPYDSRLTLARLRWGADLRSGGRGFGAAWNHDYPRAEQHLSHIIKELTLAEIRTDAGVVLGLDDPALFTYPIALMWEPGFWNLTESEAASFRAWLLKGGFAMFEDFDGPAQWDHFAAQMRRVLPEGRFVRISQAHPLFDSFFRIKDIDAIVHPMYGLRPSYYAIFENNDPAMRVMVIANFDNDVPEYWEWSGQGMFPFDTSNDAYKLGVNYVIYALTH
jgi:hypothetical protein